MSSHKVASRYAKSLIELAVERKELENVNKDVNYFKEVAENKDFKMFLKSPLVKTDKKQAIFNAIFDGKVTELTKKFFEIVLRKGRESDLPAIMSAFTTQYKVINKIDDLKITSPIELSKATVNKIKDKLIATGAISSKVEVTTEIKPELIGGVVLEFSGQMYDASILRKVNELKKEFTGNLYVSQIIAN
jgi:F-type H+-transporting ATPase subunit delta